MAPHAVTCDRISKSYMIGEHKAAYATLRDSLATGVRRALRLEPAAPEDREIWALADLSCAIEEGEVVGFIGRNGAGKSTLLKVLTRITPPTSGTATIRGRVGSILEVGTGFHPELTGRENILMNGAVLGMRRREILAKFDEIVEFSGVERFIDTPVKRYSSGMYVRLAFAVAAHLEPEVLIIDEVLAVGDHEFQQRCMGRIEDISGSGRTVLFVSHDMQAISRLCDRALWLDHGRVLAEGPAEEVVAAYLQSASHSNASVDFSHLERLPGGLARIVRARVIDASGQTAPSIDVRESIGVEVEWLALPGVSAVFPKLKIADARGEIAFNALDTDERWRVPAGPGTYVSTAWIPANLLNEGFFTLDLAIAYYDGAKLAPEVNLPNVLSFHVFDPGVGDSAKGLFTGQLRGPVRPLLRWTVVESAGGEHVGGGRAVEPARTR